MTPVEIRGFGDLQKLFNERNWPFPLTIDLTKQTTAEALVKKLDIPLDQIEIVFVNGTARGLDCQVSPGDRIAFVPPGTPPLQGDPGIC